MPWYVYSIAKGWLFYWGAVVLVLAVFLRPAGIGRLRRILFLLAAAIAITLIAVSAAALPYWLYGAWAAAILAWRIYPVEKKPRMLLALKIIVLAATAAVVAIEASYAMRPSLPAGVFPRLYVVGDSISAGLGAEAGKTWPRLIASEHHIDVVDLSQAGATIAQGHKLLGRLSLSDGLIVLEIGGNDMLGHAPAAQFEADLESLISAAEGPGRKLVMFELPLLPLDNAYGIAQRRVARRHNIMLIPKRYLVDVLQSPDATTDGLHLTAAGQRDLARTVWDLVGSGLAVNKKEPETRHAID